MATLLDVSTRSLLVPIIGLALVGASCSGSGSTAASAAGGNGVVSGGAIGALGGAGLGGATAVGGVTGDGGVTSSAGGNASVGGTVTGGNATGGTTAPIGGNQARGGSASGGVGIGGASPPLGGTSTTGGNSANGGRSNSGGTVTSSGGRSSVGGAANSGGSVSLGGSVSTGGLASVGGTGGVSSACPGADATEFELVKAWLNNTTAVGALPSYAYNNIKSKFPAGASFDKLACSIAMSCVEFSPMEAGWLRKCEALLTSAIVAESSYDPASVVRDTYATRAVSGTAADDPTVGLLQIRFSSTVHDYNYYGPIAKMSAIGCNWPAALVAQADTATFWATAGGTTYLSFMQDVACNIGLAAWYYFYNATGNGGASAVWISNYCAGNGVAGNLVVGLLSHLQGGGYARPADANNAYPWGIECCSCGNPSGCSCTGCSGRFAAFMGIGTTAARPSPDPFQETLAPEVTKYCK